MSEFAKLMVGIGIVIVSGFLGFVVAGPIFDAGARSICSMYARDEGLVFIDAEGSPLREGSLHPLPAYSCRFTDPTGSTVIVDESDHLIELTYPYRGQGLAGFLVWAFVLVVGVRLSRSLDLFQRPD